MRGVMRQRKITILSNDGAKEETRTLTPEGAGT